MATRRKINFKAKVTCTILDWATNEPIKSTSYTGALAMSTAEAKSKLTAAFLKTGALSVDEIDLTLRHPLDDAALLAERDGVARAV